MLGEGKFLYPVLQQKAELRDLIDHAFEEHNQIKSISSEQESMDASDQNWTSKVKELNEAVTHHVQEEENKVFPKAQTVINQDKAQDFAQQ